MPLPSTPSSDSDSARRWTPIISSEREREIEREVVRLYGYAPGPHPHFSNTGTNSTSYAQLPTPSEPPIRGRQVDYTHVPPVPSRLALSIPSMSQSPTISPMSTVGPSSAIPRGHYPGRPLPMPPSATSHIMSGTSKTISSTAISQKLGIAHGPYGNENASQNPEALLIDFDTEVDLNSSASGAASGGIMDRTDVAVENGDLSDTSNISSMPHAEYQAIDVSREASGGSSVVEVPAPETLQFSEYTDLDFLVSRLEGENRNGSDYDVSHSYILLYPLSLISSCPLDHSSHPRICRASHPNSRFQSDISNISNFTTCSTR